VTVGQARRGNIRAEVLEHDLRGIAVRKDVGGHVPFVVWDISEEGLGLWVPEKLRNGETLTITLTKPKAVVVTAKVVWCRERGDGFHCGLQVTEHKSRLDAIHEWLASASS